MNEEITKARKQNLKLYAMYRAISLDLIFYYAIEYLFLTEVKHLNPSSVVLGSAFYATFMVILQIPASVVVDRVGTKRCTVIANIFNMIFIFLVLNTSNLQTLILAQFVSSLCFSLKNVSDKALIQYTIPETRKKGEIFSKLEGEGTKNYYIINAITSLLSGFLYIVNPYAPMVCSLLVAALATFISLGFVDIQELKHEKAEKKKTTEYFSELKDVLKFIINSQRLRSLFLYSGICWGIYNLVNTYRSSLLVDINVPPELITAIAAIAGIASAIGSKQQLRIHKKFRNKSLSLLLIILTIGILVAGIVGIFNISYAIAVAIVTICYIFINFAKGVYEVLTSRYLSNFTTEKELTQIYAIDETCRNGLRAILGFLGSYLLEITSAANSLILVGIMMVIITCSLISYMKTRLGLKPDEYAENEIRIKRM